MNIGRCAAKGGVMKEGVAEEERPDSSWLYVPAGNVCGRVGGRVGGRWRRPSGRPPPAHPSWPENKTPHTRAHPPPPTHPSPTPRPAPSGQVAALVREGKVRPLIDRVLPLEAVVQAHEHLVGLGAQGFIGNP